MIRDILSFLFGEKTQKVTELVEVFRPNAELADQRAHQTQNAALGQFSDEFSTTSKGKFNHFVDGLNRLPRPLMALGCLGLFISAMTDPVWFASRMQGLALVPEPLWWLLGVIVSFYFGARHQLKSHEFQKSLAQTIGRVPQVVENLKGLDELKTSLNSNAALEDWEAKSRT